MRKLFTLMALSLSMLCSAEAYYDQGVCDSIPGATYGRLCWTVDTVETNTGIGLQLAFWYDEFGNTERDGDKLYAIPDYSAPNSELGGDPAPWYQYSWQIKSVDLSCVQIIGDNAFRDMGHLRMVVLPEIHRIGDNVFLGCTDMVALQVLSDIVPAITQTSLLLDEETGRQINLVLVPNEDVAGMFQMQESWGIDGRVFVPMYSYVEDMNMELSTLSDGSSMGLYLDYVPSDPENPSDLLSIEDTDSSVVKHPWNALGELIQDLTIGDYVTYIGKNAFTSLTNIQTIQFMHANHPLDSIHVDAFPMNIAPWKFALGRDLDGAAMPPKVVGVTADNDHWTQFRDITVLYVPDSSVYVGGVLRRVVDLYKDDPFWGSSFLRINDRTVDTTDITDNSIVLKWLPLENATAYELTITKLNCENNCDTTIIIPATGPQGLIDWWGMAVTPGYAPVRHAPRGNDGGGLTLTITIKPNSGSSHATDAEVTVSGLEGDAQYVYTRAVIKKDGEDVTLTKSGVFTTGKAPQAINQPVIVDQIVRVYDVLGRRVSTDIRLLPQGIYIIDNGAQRTTILLNR